MKHVKRYKELFESQTELSQEQIEWLNECTSKSWTRGSWTLNPQTGLVDVGGSFDCCTQGLSDFKGVRFGVVAGDFYCSGNKLTSLKGAPLKVGGLFECSHNALTSLEGAPQEVRSFYCFANPVSEPVLKALYKKMQSGMSWPDAVAEEWDSIESEEDKILLAPHNLNLSPEELKGYQALAKLRKRML
jgi:hypothetical protein